MTQCWVVTGVRFYLWRGRTDTTAPLCLKQCPRGRLSSWLLSHGSKGEGQGRWSPKVPRVRECLLQRPRVSVVPKQAGWGPAVLCPVPSRRTRCARSHTCCSSLSCLPSLSTRLLLGLQPTDLPFCLRTQLPPVSDQGVSATGLLWFSVVQS